MFEPITPRETAVDACARVLRRRILEGDLAPGDRLPPERRLAESLGVTRVTLRAALTQLAAAGLVAARQGSGTVVQDFRRRGGPDLLLPIAALAASARRLPEIAADLLLVRRQLARAVLSRIAAAPRIDAAPVAEAVAALEEAAARGAPTRDIAAADLEVVRALLEATGSEVLGLFFNPIMAALEAMPALRQVIYREPAANVAGYQVLLAWLERRPAEAIDAVVAELERRDADTVARLAEEKTS